MIFLNVIWVYLKYLQEKERTDDLFNDPCYSGFEEELNKVLKGWQPSVLPDGKCSASNCKFMSLVIKIVQWLEPLLFTSWTKGVDSLLWGPFKVNSPLWKFWHIKNSICCVLCSGSLWGRVEEPCLWSSRQLGEHSPSVLLRSLVYLNTKYFGLRTVEQHMRLSFGNVYGPSTPKPHNHNTTVCICIPSISQDQGTF